MLSIASRRERRGARKINYNESSLWSKTLRDSSSNESSEEEVKKKPASRKTTRKNYADLSSSAIYSNSEYDDYEEDVEEEEEVYEYEEEIYEEEEEQFAIQAILGRREEQSSANISDSEEKTEDSKKDEVYYVKFQDRAYIHCQWLSESEIMAYEGGENALLRFKRKLSKVYLSPSISIDNLLTFEDQEINSVWFVVDRIIDDRGSEKEGDLEYLVKWQSVDYNEATWEKPEDIPDKNKISEYKKRLETSNPIKIPARWKRPNPNRYVELEEGPSTKNGFVLRDYQLEGLNWLRFNWYNQRNNILADEMGLGKTAQIVSLLNDMMINEAIRGPFLVVAPLSTLPHWHDEFGNWSNLNTIIYHGNADSREIIKQCEFNVVNSKGKTIPGRVQFDVIVTNYETILQDFNVFKDIEWRYIVFDEGHKLKNSNGKLYQKVESLYYEHCTMLTGTPIQNCMEELWGLLHLLHPEKFDDLQEFSRKYGNMTDSDQVKEIQAIIKPIMLRRKKSDVEKSIAPKEETIVEVELTRVQKKFYRAFLHENAGTLLNQITGGALNSLQNLMMQLRKVCNHPYLIKGAEESVLREKRVDPANEGKNPKDIELEAMIMSSGKLVFIDKLLPRLKDGGHKILIFSQMVRVLSIIEQYLVSCNYKYERIDGSVQENDRAAAIDRFNYEPDEFVFLLSTRAGGVGINLTAADTVIIYDSDWNPQNDIQAEARCHRIGQTQKVKVYRLITRDTYESKMFERASRKLGLDHVVLDGGDMNKEKPMKASEIEEMLRNGVTSIFKDDDSKADEFTSADIEQILSRRAKVTMSDVISGGDSIFAKASFNADGDSLDMNSKDFWTNVLPPERTNSEEYLVRRCRRDKYDEEAQNTNASTVNNIIAYGCTNKLGEMSIIKQAYSLRPPKSKADATVIKNLIGEKTKEGSDVERLLGELGVLVDQRAEKIISRTAYFIRLRRALYLIQQPDIKWPVISPPWEDPVAEYALMVGVNRYGMHQLSEIPTDKELGLQTARPLTKTAIEKRIHNLFKAFEAQFADSLEQPIPNEFQIMNPEEWKTLHSNVLARKTLYDTEILSLIQSMCYIGVPMNGEEIDWEKLKNHSKLTLVTTSAIKDVGEQIIDVAREHEETVEEKPEEGNEKVEESEVIELEGYPLLKGLQGKIVRKDIRKVKQSIRDMGKIYKFCSKLGPKRLDLMKYVPKSHQVPEWWSWEHDDALINNLAKHGLSLSTSWITDPNCIFYKHIPKELLTEFEEAAEKERSKSRSVKPSDQGELTFLFRERTRVGRVLHVIQYVSKELAKQKKEKSGEKSGRSRKKSNSQEDDCVLKVGPQLKILNFGEIWLKKGFYTKNSVYPVGYECLRHFKLRCSKAPSYWYRCEIAAVDEKPVFRVSTVNRKDPRKYESDNPNTVWILIANSLAQEYGEKPQKVIGTWMYGLNSKEVQRELAKLPNGNLLSCLAEEPQTLDFKVKLKFVSNISFKTPLIVPKINNVELNNGE